MLSTDLVAGKERRSPMSEARERFCYRCGGDIGPTLAVGRRDTCLACGADLHCCLNCDFYDPAYHNHCREPHSELQVDKQVGNFCDLFRFRRGRREAANPTGRARTQLEQLFRKPR